MEMVNALLFDSLLCLMSISHVVGTGALIDPPARSVLWKYGFEVATNYDYMRVNCGGLDKIREQNGKCGVCGDPYDGQKDNELNGKFGSGIIGRYYPAETQDIHVKVDLTGHLKGYFEFRICAANNDPVTQECLNRNLLPIREGFTQGSPMRFFPTENGIYNLTIAIPPGFSCERCVLQWRYYTGNSWGVNPDGSQCIGCGLQEQFQNCADIRIGGSIPEPMQSNKLYKENGWLDVKEHTAGSKSDKIRIQTAPNATSSLNSTAINRFDNITNLVTHIDRSSRLSSLQSSSMSILGVNTSNDPQVASSDPETPNLLASNNENNLSVKTVQSLLEGMTAQPDSPSPKFSALNKFEQPVIPKQPKTEKDRLLDLTNIKSDQILKGNLLDVLAPKPVQNNIDLTLKGSRNDHILPLVKDRADKKLSQMLDDNLLTSVGSGGSLTGLSVALVKKSNNASSKESIIPVAIDSTMISEQSASITINSKMPRHVQGLKSEFLGPTNVLESLDLTKVSRFDSPFVRSVNISTSSEREPRTALTNGASSGPSNVSAPLSSQGFNIVEEKSLPGQELLGLRESPSPLIKSLPGQELLGLREWPSPLIKKDMDLVRQSTNERNINIGSVPSASGSVRRGQNGAVSHPNLATFAGQQGKVSQQGAHETVSSIISTNASAATGVPSDNVVQKAIGPIFTTDVQRRNRENLPSNVPGVSNSLLRNSDTGRVSQFSQNNLPSAAGQFPQNFGPGRIIMTPPSVASGVNRRLPPGGTQGQIPGLMVIPQNVNDPIQLVDAPRIPPNAPLFMTFVPWSSAFSPVGATSATEVGAILAQASSQTGPGNGMIPEIQRTSPMFIQPIFRAGLGEFPEPRDPLVAPIPNGPLPTRIGSFPVNQPGPLPLMPPQPFLGRPGLVPIGLPFGPQMNFSLRPQPFVLG